MFSVGIALTVLGAASLAASAATLAAAAGSRHDSAAPAVFGLTGLVSVGAGIPLIVVGAQKVRSSWAAPPTVSLGPGRADVLFRF